MTQLRHEAPGGAPCRPKAGQIHDRSRAIATPRVESRDIEGARLDLDPRDIDLARLGRQGGAL
jgi:hypothetical protein